MKTTEERKAELKHRREKLIKCIIESEGVSDFLKTHLENQIKKKEKESLNLRGITLELSDKKIVGDCIRKNLRNESKLTRTINTNNKAEIKDSILADRGRLSPMLISLDPIPKSRLVPKEKINTIYRRGRFPNRRLEMLPSLGKFKLAGIFECLEYAQDAIKIIRGAVNMIRSMDYTSAVISIYDNLNMIGDALSYCFNAILPSE